MPSTLQGQPLECSQWQELLMSQVQYYQAQCAVAAQQIQFANPEREIPTLLYEGCSIESSKVPCSWIRRSLVPVLCQRFTSFLKMVNTMSCCVLSLHRTFCRSSRSQCYQLCRLRATFPSSGKHVSFPECRHPAISISIEHVTLEAGHGRFARVDP
jgi:hypothetical protein